MSALILPDEYRTKPAKRSLSAERAVRAKYDAAQTNRNNQNHWAEADALSAAAANTPEVREKLRNRSRYECANNTYANGMVATLANDTIGTGPTLQMQTGSQELDAAVEMAWWEWVVATRMDDKLRTMRMAQTRDGEAFAIFSTNYNLRNPVKLDMRLYEAEQVAAPWQKMDLSYQNDGIIFDDFGNPFAYTVLRYHPGGTGYVRYGEDAYDMVPARDVIHLFKCDRPGQVRGIPEITPALPLYAQLRRFTLAVIAAAETAADIAGIIKTQHGAEDPDDLEPMDAVEIVKRTLLTLPSGYDISQLKAEQPTTTYQMFKEEIINEIARCLNMPYNVAAGNSSKYNYASGRLDHKTYFKSIRVDRARLQRDCLDVTLLRWWEEARLIPGLLPNELRNLDRPPMHGWAWDGDEHVDPQKEANAAEIRLQTLTTTLAREYAKQGLDWRDELTQVAAELGITLDELLQRRLNAMFPAAPAATAPAQDQQQGDTPAAARLSRRDINAIATAVAAQLEAA